MPLTAAAGELEQTAGAGWWKAHRLYDSPVVRGPRSHAANIRWPPPGGVDTLALGFATPHIRPRQRMKLTDHCSLDGIKQLLPNLAATGLWSEPAERAARLIMIREMTSVMS